MMFNGRWKTLRSASLAGVVSKEKIKEKQNMKEKEACSECQEKKTP
jgi:hypothetical protein